jgi:hypothetical protein
LRPFQKKFLSHPYLNLHKHFNCDLRFSLSYAILYAYIWTYMNIFEFYEFCIILQLMLRLYHLRFYFSFLILHKFSILTTMAIIPSLCKKPAPASNVVRVEVLRRIGGLVMDRKHKGRSTVRKILLKGKVVTSHI